MSNVRRAYTTLYKLVDTLIYLNENSNDEDYFERVLDEVKEALSVNKELYHKASRNE